MKALNYRPVADHRGQFLAWVDELRNQSGAYIIRDKNSKRILYVGESHTGRLAKTLKRHFFDWNDDPERQHHTYQRGRVEVAVRLTPPGSAAGAQNNLILRLEPRDNGTNPKAEDPF